MTKTCRVFSTKKLGAILHQRGITPDALADMTGISIGCMERIVKGRSTPCFSYVRGMATVLGVPIGALYEPVQDDGLAAEAFNTVIDRVNAHAREWSDDQKLRIVKALFATTDRRYAVDEYNARLREWEDMVRDLEERTNKTHTRKPEWDEP